MLRPLYGVPSSPRDLHKTLDFYFKGEGFTNAGFEESVWQRPADAKYAADIVISCHVDDNLIACSSLFVMRKFKSALLQRFTGTDEGPVTQYPKDDVKLAQLVRARDYQSRGRRFDSGKNSKT